LTMGRGTTVDGYDLFVSGDLASDVGRYLKTTGQYIFQEVYYSYRNSGLAHDGINLWGVLPDVGFITNSISSNGYWQGFYTGFRWNYRDLDSRRAASGFIEDIEFSVGRDTLWAHAFDVSSQKSYILGYVVSNVDFLPPYSPPPPPVPALHGLGALVLVVFLAGMACYALNRRRVKQLHITS